MVQFLRGVCMQTFKLNSAFLLEEICCYAAVKWWIRPFIIIGQRWESFFFPFNYRNMHTHFKAALNVNLFLNFHVCIFSSSADKTAKSAAPSWQTRRFSLQWHWRQPRHRPAQAQRAPGSGARHRQFPFCTDTGIYSEKEKLLCRYESKDTPSEVNIIPLLSKFINNKCTIFLLSLAAGREVVSKHSFFQIN